MKNLILISALFLSACATKPKPPVKPILSPAVVTLTEAQYKALERGTELPSRYRIGENGKIIERINKR